MLGLPVASQRVFMSDLSQRTCNQSSALRYADFRKGSSRRSHMAASIQSCAPFPHTADTRMRDSRRGGRR